MTAKIVPVLNGERLDWFYLTDRERLVLAKVGEGLNDREIAENLRLTPKTVSAYVSEIKDRLRAGSRAHAVVLAIALGYLRIEGG